MSELYRDDVQATAVVSDAVRFGFAQRFEDVLRAHGGTDTASGVWWTDSLRVGVDLFDAAVLSVSVGAGCAVRVRTRTNAAARCAVRTRGRGMVLSPQAVVVADSVRIGAVLQTDGMGWAVSQGHLTETVRTGVSASAQVADVGRGKGEVRLWFADVVNGGTARGMGLASLQVRQLGSVQGAARIAAQVRTVSAAAASAVSSVRVADGLSVRLRAGNVLSVSASAWGGVVRDNNPAQAWTAETDGWAVSRYLPLPFLGWAVADGKLLAWGTDGLYELSEAADAPDAWVQTGLIDVSGGALAHPTDVFLEYAADAVAELTVSTLQNGKSADFTYRLPRETAQVLTSGRFILGRGLRGRHFALRLAFSGGQARINDMVLRVAALKRRI